MILTYPLLSTKIYPVENPCPEKKEAIPDKGIASLQ
jgi:hypothetical protein